MPNWVQNEIVLEGNDENIKKVLSLVRSDDSEMDDCSSEFDFNKIIPMPSELNIASSSRNDDAIIYYASERLTIPFDDIDKKYLYYVKNMFNENFAYDLYNERIPNGITLAKERNDVNYEDELYNLGKVCCSNIDKYGYVDWYNWCYDNWGTKWTASDVFINDNVILFQTAWASPGGILEKFAEICEEHNVSFKGCYADEDMGCNTGCFDSKNGFTEYDNGSSDALRTYCYLWGEECSCISEDEDGNYIRYDCETCPNKDDC